MSRPFKTRDGKLKNKIENEITKSKPDMGLIMGFVRDYEQDNLNTINKLKKNKKAELKKINGALKQAINAHGPITAVLIGSASKRIYGSLLLNEPKPEEIDNRMPIKLAVGILVTGIVLGSIVTMLI
jgi:hypothetical protein